MVNKMASDMTGSTREKFEAAVNVIQGLPKNGEYFQQPGNRI